MSGIFDTGIFDSGIFDSRYVVADLSATFEDLQQTVSSRVVVQASVVATFTGIESSLIGSPLVQGVFSTGLEPLTTSSLSRIGVGSRILAGLDELFLDSRATARLSARLITELDPVQAAVGGRARLSGALTSTLDSATVLASGEAEQEAVFGAPFEPLSLHASGRAIIDADGSWGLDELTLSATATARLGGYLHATLDDVQAASTGRPIPIRADLSTALSPLDTTLSGIAPGTLRLTAGLDTLTAVGTAQAIASLYTSTTLDSLGVSASGRLPIHVDGDLRLADDTPTIRVSLPVQAALDTLLSDLSASAEVTVRDPQVSCILVTPHGLPQPHLTGLSYAWFDDEDPADLGAPLVSGTTETTDADGTIVVPVPGTRHTVGGAGLLILRSNSMPALGAYNLTVE